MTEIEKFTFAVSDLAKAALIQSDMIKSLEDRVAKLEKDVRDLKDLYNPEDIADAIH